MHRFPTIKSRQRKDVITAGPTPRTEFNWELEAQAITLRIRWFGIAAGYALVNLLGNSSATFTLNAILALGAVYALCDTYFSARGRVFLRQRKAEPPLDMRLRGHDLPLD